MVTFVTVVTGTLTVVVFLGQSHTDTHTQMKYFPGLYIHTHTHTYIHVISKLRILADKQFFSPERFVFPVALTFTEKGMLLPTGGNLGRRSEKYQRLPLNNGESTGLEKF